MIARIVLPVAASLMTLAGAPVWASNPAASPIVLAQASSGPWIPYCQRFRNSAQRERCNQEVMSGYYGGGYYQPRYDGYYGYYGPPPGAYYGYY